MKQAFKIFILFFSMVSFAKAQNPCTSITTCGPWQNADMQRLAQYIAYYGATSTSTTAATIRLDTIQWQQSGRYSGFTLTWQSGTVTAGASGALSNAKSLTFSTSPTFVGDINGVSRGGNAVISISAPDGGMITPVTFNVTTGTLYYERLYKP